MDGLIVSYRRGKRTMRGNQVILRVEGIKSRTDAAQLVGRKVIFKTTTGKQIVGKISAPHGNTGAVRAWFRKGLPGQAIGQKVAIE